MAIPIPGNVQSSAASAADARLSSSQGINVFPTALNLGAILQPYTDSAYNGGFGLTDETPFGPRPFWRPSGSTSIKVGGPEFNPGWIVAGAGVVLLALLMFKRSK